MDQGSGCIESHGPANQAKYQSKFFKFLKRNGGFFGRSLGAGESRKSYRASRSSQQLLEGLSTDIYTPLLRQLKEASQDLQAVAKSSGAGGGDCGIALSFDAQSTETLKIVGPIWELSSYIKKG